MSMSMPHLSEARARQSLRASRLPFNGKLERASSTNNEIHLSEHHVIRVSSELSQRLCREAELYPHLPQKPWGPILVAKGQQAGTHYLIVERKPGQPLAHVWPFHSVPQRRKAVTDLAACLRAIHTTPTPQIPKLASTLHLIGPTLGAPAVAPLQAGLRRLSEKPNADLGVIGAAQDYVDTHGHHLDGYNEDYLIHGDLTFENVLASGDGITALIDFEWCRGAPRDFDLDVLLRCCALPQAHVAQQFQTHTLVKDYLDVPVWLAEDYPTLFSHPALAERLTLYALAFDVRDLLEYGTIPAYRSDVDDLHPYNRLINLISTGGHIQPSLARIGLSV